jgi:RNA polymerase sigma-70 factor (ECF subfamily)
MHRNEVSDKQLVSEYLNGSERAFEVLLQRHQERIYLQIKSMVRDSALADDIFQETFVKAIRTLKQGKYNEEGKFLPWILRIAHNLSIDNYRKLKKMPTVRSTDDYDVFATIPREEMSIEEIMIQDVVHEDLKKILDELPPDQREVVIMRHYGGMSFREISEQCNVSINTSLGRMRYALINMRKIIEENKIVLTK